MAPKNNDHLPPGLKDEARRTIHCNCTGEIVTIKKYSYETNGERTIAEVTCSPGGGPPYHYHRKYAVSIDALHGG
jgi:hypothetical protein